MPKKFIIFLLALLRLSCFASSAPQAINLYITPKHGNCSISGTVLSPCYSLHQLANENILSSLNVSSVTLLLLSGTHLIPGNDTLNVSGFDQVVIQPWNGHTQVVIECEGSQKADGQVILNDNNAVNMSSLHFTSCILKYRYNIQRDFERSVYITKCIFEGSREDFTISIWCTESRVKKVKVSNCTFLSNTAGAIAVLTRQGNPYIVTDLSINDTLFQSNRNEHCGGAVKLERTNLLLDDSQFVSNVA